MNEDKGELLKLHVVVFKSRVKILHLNDLIELTLEGENLHFGSLQGKC